jgi:2-hydroxychromene-2-carboxylate isomerase
VTGAAASFYFDLQSPLAYLAAERVLHVLPGPAQWRPVLARELGGAQALGSLRGREEQDVFRAEVALRARELHLQPLRWPEPFPFDSELAMRVATYAASIGRAVPFAQAAFRQAFAGGRSLADPDNVVIAAAACEMHPAAVLKGAQLRSTAAQLREATAQASGAGVREVPTVVVASEVFAGERALDAAAERARELGAAASAAGAAAASAAGAGAKGEAGAGAGPAGSGPAAPGPPR